MTTAAFTDQELDTALDKAVLGLFLSPPRTNRNTRPAPSTFITTIYAALRRAWSDRIPTACTNGRQLLINPTFFMGLSEQMRTTLLAHECWHVAFLHCDETRRGDREPRQWNIACDYAINNMLYDFGFQFDLGLLDPKYNEMSAEEIYDKLDKDDLPPLPFDDIEIDIDPASKHEVLGTVIRAMQASKMNSREHGSVPGAIGEMVDEILNPKLPWYVLLARFLNERSEFGYRWSRPNRRYLPLNTYLPSPGGQEGLSHIMWGCDDSGSMSAENLGFMNGEMKGCKERLKPDHMTVVSFDTQIQDHWEFTDEDDLTRLEFHGRGGTNIAPFFEFAKEAKVRPYLLVVMSDLECSIPPNPGIEVLWIRFGTNGCVPDYGTVIQVDR